MDATLALRPTDVLAVRPSTALVRRASAWLVSARDATRWGLAAGVVVGGAHVAALAVDPAVGTVITLAGHALGAAIGVAAVARVARRHGASGAATVEVLACAVRAQRGQTSSGVAVVLEAICAWRDGEAGLLGRAARWMAGRTVAAVLGAATSAAVAQLSAVVRHALAAHRVVGAGIQAGVYVAALERAAERACQAVVSARPWPVPAREPLIDAHAAGIAEWIADLPLAA